MGILGVRRVLDIMEAKSVLRVSGVPWVLGGAGYRDRVSILRHVGVERLKFLRL